MNLSDLIPKLFMSQYDLYISVGIGQTRAKELALVDVRRVLANMIEAAAEIADKLIKSITDGNHKG